LTRLILAICLALTAAPALAQPDWTSQDRRERREERRRERRERWEEWRRNGHDGVHLRLLRDYYLRADATTAEPIVVLGGDATIDGRADDDVVVIGGTLRLGPKAVVGGDVVTVGGQAVIDPGAQVRGDIDEAVVSWPDLGINIGWPDWPVMSWQGWWPFAALSVTMLRLTLVLIVSVLLTVVVPGWIRAMGVRASSVFSSGLLGAAIEVLFVPALMAVVIGLLISIVGIPLLGAVPFVLAAGAIAWIGGFAAVAACLGARLRGSSIARSSSPLVDLLIGFFAITALTLLAHFIAVGPAWFMPLGWMVRAAGTLVEYVAWTIGLGAAISNLFVRSPAMPPPVPAPSVP
jgi:hypothetical protein